MSNSKERSEFLGGGNNTVAQSFEVNPTEVQVLPKNQFIDGHSGEMRIRVMSGDSCVAKTSGRVGSYLSKISELENKLLSHDLDEESRTIFQRNLWLVKHKLQKRRKSNSASDRKRRPRRQVEKPLDDGGLGVVGKRFLELSADCVMVGKEAPGSRRSSRSAAVLAKERISDVFSNEHKVYQSQVKNRQSDGGHLSEGLFF